MSGGYGRGVIDEINRIIAADANYYPPINAQQPHALFVAAPYIVFGLCLLAAIVLGLA